jgi:tRNA A-37 threonylcarbamoyl transferase component Bud32
MAEGNAAQIDGGSLVGQIVHGHEIVRLLGAGGMGEVYLARHQSLGVERAIKVIHDDHRSDDKARKRFAREADALSQLQHHNVVQIIDYGEVENGWPFLCMEYVAGRDLEAAVRDGGPLALADALVVLGQVAAALAYAHARGIVHRDLKPANAILRHGDPRQLKLIDFGLVRMISRAMMTRLTAEQQMVGSPVYMAPEQADGSIELTGAADVYAIAGIAYYLLSGQPVFPDRPLLSLIYAHAQESPERLSQRLPHLELPKLLDELLAASLAKKAADRPTADELAAHFDRMAVSAADDPRARQRIAMDQTLAAPGAAPPARPEAARAVAADGARVAAGSVSVPSYGGGAPVDAGGVEVAQSAVRAARLSGLIFDDAGPDPSGIREPLVNQTLAVIGDIGAELGATDGEIARLTREIERLDGAVTDAEMELALADAALAEAGPAARGDLDQQRARAVGRARQQAAALRDAQLALIERIERARERAAGSLAALFAELDGLSERIEGLAE